GREVAAHGQDGAQRPRIDDSEVFVVQVTATQKERRRERGAKVPPRERLPLDPEVVRELQVGRLPDARLKAPSEPELEPPAAEVGPAEQRYLVEVVVIALEGLRVARIRGPHERIREKDRERAG